MEKAKAIAKVVGVVLGFIVLIGGAIFGREFKDSICGAPSIEQGK